MTAVLALSLSSEIEKYGAYAGIAAVVGLGVLSLLYFAQAREVKRLREWAGRAPERDADLQQRVVAEAQVRTAAPPPRPRPAGPATPAGVAAAKPAAPATGAPVLAAHPGTPTGAKPPVPATVAAAAATGVAAAGAKPAAAATAAAPPASTTVPASETAPGAVPGTPPPAAGTPVPAVAPAGTPGTPPPATVAAQSPPASTPASPTASPATTPPVATPGITSPSTPAGSTPAAPPAPAEPPLAATPTPPPPRSRPRPAAAPVRATRPDAGVASRTGAEPPRQGSRRGLLGVILGGVAIIAIAALLITQVFSGGSDKSGAPKPNSVGTPTATSGTDGASKTAQPDRAGTRVAVLNGTPVAGLARAAADKLTAVGYRDVSPVATDTTNQTRATTVVYWQSGTRRAGLDVAKALGLGRAALQVMDQNARVLGGGAPVVVVVGADQAK